MILRIVAVHLKVNSSARLKKYRHRFGLWKKIDVEKSSARDSCFEFRREKFDGTRTLVRPGGTSAPNSYELMEPRTPSSGEVLPFRVPFSLAVIRFQ